ncbi:MAG: hypothetical protein ABIK15_02135 [Pseudomonadota bacterium]
MKQKEIKEYCHEDLNMEVQAIGGRYVLTAENRLPHGDEEILYLTGYAVFDSTCCGAGGCTYAVVYGTILSWKQKTGKNGIAVSEVLPIKDESARKTIRKTIMEKEQINQVVFL